MQAIEHAIFTRMHSTLKKSWIYRLATCQFFRDTWGVIWLGLQEQAIAIVDV